MTIMDTSQRSLRERLRPMGQHFRFMPAQVWVSAAVIAAAAFLAVAGPWVAPVDAYAQDPTLSLRAPGSPELGEGIGLLGTDQLGRDTFSRLLVGARPLGIVVAGCVSLASTFGLAFGLIAGFSRGIIANPMMRLADIQLSIPGIVLAILIAVALSPGVLTSVLAIALVTWPEYARVVRSEVLRVRTSDYVRLARVAGMRERKILVSHVLPNVLNTFVVLLTLNLAIAMIFASGLSFLGVGVQEPTPDWGNMLGTGTRYLTNSPWLVIVPGSAITVCVLAFNILGDYARDVLDPRIDTGGHGGI